MRFQTTWSGIVSPWSTLNFFVKRFYASVEKKYIKTKGEPPMELVGKVGMGASAHDKPQTHDDFDACLDKQVVGILEHKHLADTENPDKN